MICEKRFDIFLKRGLTLYDLLCQYWYFIDIHFYMREGGVQMCMALMSFQGDPSNSMHQIGSQFNIIPDHFLVQCHLRVPWSDPH